MPVTTVKRDHLPRALKTLYNFVDSLSASKRYSEMVVVNATDLSTPTNQEFVVPYDGFFEGFRTVIQTAIVTGGIIKAQLNTVDVTGATITVADGATVGTRQNAAFTRVAVSAGDRITIVPGAPFNGGGAINVTLGFTAN